MLISMASCGSKTWRIIIKSHACFSLMHFSSEACLEASVYTRLSFIACHEMTTEVEINGGGWVMLFPWGIFSWMDQDVVKFVLVSKYQRLFIWCNQFFCILCQSEICVEYSTYLSSYMGNSFLLAVNAVKQKFEIV